MIGSADGMADQVPSWSDNDSVTALSSVAQAIDQLAAIAETRPVGGGASAEADTGALPLQNLPAHLVFARHWESHRHQFLARSIERACPLCGGGERWTWFHSQDGYRYDICRSCNMVHIPEFIPLDVWDDYYRSLPQARDFLREQLLGSVGDQAIQRDRERFMRYLSLLRSHGAATAGSRLLDVGSYTGAWIRLAAEHGVSAFGIEGLAEAVRFAAEQFPGLPLQHTRFEDLDAAAFGGNFDVVTLWETLEHTLDPIGALKRVSRAIRPGGLLAVSVPNARNVQFTALGPYCFYAYGGYHYTGHINMFSPLTLERALRESGFDLVHISTEYGTDWRQVAHYLRHQFERIHCYRNLLSGSHAVADPGPDLSVILNWLSPTLTRLENACLAGPILIALAKRR